MHLDHSAAGPAAAAGRALLAGRARAAGDVDGTCRGARPCVTPGPMLTRDLGTRSLLCQPASVRTRDGDGAGDLDDEGLEADRAEDAGGRDLH